MEKKKLMGKGLKRLLIITVIVAVLFIGSFAAYAYFVKAANDADLADILGVLKYHGNGIVELFLFKFGDPKEIVYFAMSAFAYAVAVCWLIFFIAGLVVNKKRERKVMWWGIILTLLNVGVYLVCASGYQKFIAIFKQDNGFANHIEILILAIAVVALGAIFFILSIVAYFWAIVDCYKREEQLEEEPKEEKVGYHLTSERVRQIVREELIAAQPFKVIVVGGAKKQEPAPQVVYVKDEVKEEPVPEPVKEEPQPEPQPEPMPTVDFWEVAREVWPQLDHPNPLPKEEPKEEPLPVFEEEPAEEEGEGGQDEWNRSKRQPFINRILTADADIKANYNEIKNEVLSYGVKARLSRGGETFRLHEKKYVKIYLVGKTLKVYFALSPEDYKDSTFPIEDVGHRPNYADIPLLFKVRSGLSVRRCKELVKAACEKDGLTQKEVGNTNWVAELRSLNAEKNKKAKENK